MENDRLLLQNNKSCDYLTCDNTTTTTTTTTTRSIKKISLNDVTKKNGSEMEATYFHLLQTNRPFCLYMLSYLATEMGVWFTYVASISIIDNLFPGSYIRVTILVVIRLLPNLLISTFGGILADSRDRRISMISLDACGAIVAILYLFVLKTESILLLYFLTFTQQCIAALYEPVRQAIIPMFVSDDAYLLKATTLVGLSWSMMAAIGSGLGGWTTAILGPEGCFLLDSLTYIASAFLMWFVGGTWKPRSKSIQNLNALIHPSEEESSSFWEAMKTMTIDGYKYIKSSPIGTIVFMKGSGAIIWGSFDVFNVAFSRIEGDDKVTNERLGLLFAYVGLGCTIGPVLADYSIDMRKDEKLQQVCIFSLGLITFSVIGMCYFTSFFSVCVLTITRSLGSSTIWVFSSVILQKFIDNDILGRVTAIEYAFAMLCESLSALFAGVAQDNYNLSAQESCQILSIVGTIICIAWCTYHINGGGLANSYK